jgi:D-amino-acid oxidase
VRRQVLHVRAPAVDTFTLDEEGPTYVVPREDGVVVCGGTAEDGRRPGLRPGHAGRDPPAVRGPRPAPRRAPVLTAAAGIRPVRPEVRLAADRLPDGRPVVHNYGHGGAGVTLSWGCAAEVVALFGAASWEVSGRR